MVISSIIVSVTIVVAILHYYYHHRRRYCYHHYQNYQYCHQRYRRYYHLFPTIIIRILIMTTSCYCSYYLHIVINSFINNVTSTFRF